MSIQAKSDYRDKILRLWSALSHEQQETLMLELLRETDVGRRIAEGGFLPFIPHHMWEHARKDER